MTSSEKVSVAALISVILRRKINRTIDVKCLVTNDAYAQEIIKLCREQGQNDLTEYADRLEQLTFGKSSAAAASFAVTESLKPSLVCLNMMIQKMSLTKPKIS